MNGVKVMLDLKDKQTCCGCGVCAEVCPEKAIEMVYDEKGFAYPGIHHSKCKECGICVKRCSFKNDKENGQNWRSVYAMRHLSEEVVSKSSSGGFFTAISDYVLNNGGYVFGSVFDAKEKKVKHICARTFEERNRMRGSKYVQSETIGIYSKVKTLLDDGNLVLFTGTPCQCASLLTFVRKKYDNLIVVDLLCHGVPSPILFRDHIEWWEKKYKSKVTDYRFRDKRYGYLHTHMVRFENQKENHSLELKRLLKMYRYSMRESCYVCPYASKHRYGDFTIGDFWEIGKVASIYDNKGSSIILVNSQKAEEVLEKIKSVCSLISIDFSHLKQDAVNRPVKRTEEVNQFWECYQQSGYKRTLDCYAKNTIKSRVYQTMLRMVHVLRIEKLYYYFISRH